MIEPRKEDERDPVAAEVAGLGNRVSVLEVKLDGLTMKVDEGFKRMDRGFEESEMRFEKLDDRFERMQRHLLTAAVMIIVALIGAPHL